MIYYIIVKYLNLSITDSYKVWNHDIVNVRIYKKKYVLVCAHVKYIHLCYIKCVKFSHALCSYIQFCSNAY